MRLDRWEGELRQRRRDGTQITVASRWTTVRDNNGKSLGWLEINTDITARKVAEENARRLSARILTLQDDERRRIARGLHDSLGQYLVALKMALESLSAVEESKAAVAECFEIVDKCIMETRTISYLLHPPMLDEAGFGFAARWYVDGFAQRSGITVNLSLPPMLDRMERDVEIALFRAVQESLTNVHKHSGAAAVDIFLRIEPKEIRLEIEDDGKGIAPKHLKRVEGGAETGVGIAGMRERIRELGGLVKIESKRKGTRVVISIPVEKTNPDVEESGESHRSVSA
jgi:signal transduction histidine kinase